MPVLTGELGTMGRCDATFFSTMQSKEGNTHTHTHIAVHGLRAYAIPEP